MRSRRLTPITSTIQARPRRLPRVRRGKAFIVLWLPTDEPTRNSPELSRTKHLTSSMFVCHRGGETFWAASPRAVAMPGKDRISPDSYPGQGRPRRYDATEYFPELFPQKIFDCFSPTSIERQIRPHIRKGAIAHYERCGSYTTHADGEEKSIRQENRPLPPDQSICSTSCARFRRRRSEW